MKLNRLSNMTIYTVYASFWKFAFGLMSPFIVLFMKDLSGSVEQVGIASALLVFVFSVIAYFAGKYSDKFGRKPVLILFLYAESIAILSYAFVQTVVQLYILQILLGALSAVTGIVDFSLISDITSKKTRGAQIGKLLLIVGMFNAAALVIGGYLVGRFGYDVIFYLVSAVGFIGTTALFWIKEDKRK